MISNAAVVDTNIILSALISKSSGIRGKIFDETMNYFAPNFIIIELYKHKEKLLKYFGAFSCGILGIENNFFNPKK
jgi:predicted nucleic acid-binding protein